MKKIISIVSLILVSALLLASCGSAGIVGKWETTVGGITMSMEFDNDGKGAISSLGMSVDFTYVISGDKITMTTEVSDTDATFSISGDELTLITAGVKQIYTKVK